MQKLKAEIEIVTKDPSLVKSSDGIRSPTARGSPNLA
jgi:hypothetical protein